MIAGYPIPEAGAIYLDHHASTPLLPEVLEAMEPWFERGYGNPSNTLHAFGRDARKAVEWAREQVAALINAEPRQIIFTSGATEANNLALRGFMNTQHSSSALLISELEHESVAQPAEQLNRAGYPGFKIAGDSTGMITPEAVHDALRSAVGTNSEPKLISVIAVQGEIGTINPMMRISEAGHEFGTVVHTDAAQAVGKIPVDVDAWNVDLLTIAAHKMYGPKGIGALYTRERDLLKPILYGADHEDGLRPGTENVPYIVGFGAACRTLAADLESEAARQRRLRDRLWEWIRNEIPDARLNGHPQQRHPGNLHFSLPDINSVELVRQLPQYALSVGSACHSDNPMENPLIETLGIPGRYAQGSIRIGLGRANTEQQLRQFAQDLAVAYKLTTGSAT